MSYDTEKDPEKTCYKKLQAVSGYPVLLPEFSIKT